MQATIRPLDAADADVWRRMRAALGPEWVEDNIDEMVASYLATGTIDHLPHAVLIAEIDRRPVGFAEVSLRAFAEGCETSPVGYLEGWYVEPAHQGGGIGRQLVDAGIRWALTKGCREFASDAEIHNEPSHQAHAALGFEPVCEIRCYRKRISPDP